MSSPCCNEHIQIIIGFIVYRVVDLVPECTSRQEKGVFYGRITQSLLSSMWNPASIECTVLHELWEQLL